MRYILTVIDVFSEFDWAIPVDSKDVKAITVAFGQMLLTANPRHSQRQQTEKSKKVINSTFQGLWSTTISSTLPVRASKRRPWWSDSTAPSRLGYGHICRTAAQCAKWMSSRTWSTPTTTRVSAPSTWRQPMYRRITRIVSVCASLDTATFTLSL